MQIKVKDLIGLAISLFLYKFLLDLNSQKLEIAQELKKNWEITLNLLNQNKLAPVKKSYKLVIDNITLLISLEEAYSLRGFMKSLLILFRMIRREGNKSKEYYTVLNLTVIEALNHSEMQKSKFLRSRKSILVKNIRKK
jgi:hypothetical protein